MSYISYSYIRYVYVSSSFPFLLLFFLSVRAFFFSFTFFFVVPLSFSFCLMFLRALDPKPYPKSMWECKTRGGPTPQTLSANPEPGGKTRMMDERKTHFPPTQILSPTQKPHFPKYPPLSGGTKREYKNPRFRTAEYKNPPGLI